MATVTVRAEAEILDGWERESLHTVERTKFVDAMIREGYVTVVDENPDEEAEPIGATAQADLTVQAVAVPAKDADVDTWRQFLTTQGVVYTVDQAEDAGQLQDVWAEHQGQGA